MAEMTLPQYLIRNVRQFPDRPALREKEKGIWQQWTWAEYLDHVRAIALGLVSLGFERGDKLALLSDNRPELYAAMLAAQAAGGVPVPLYQGSIARELQYVVDHADARFIYAEDQEQVDKVLDLKEHLPPAFRHLLAYSLSTSRRPPRRRRSYTPFRPVVQLTDLSARFARHRLPFSNSGGGEAHPRGAAPVLRLGQPPSKARRNRLDTPVVRAVHGGEP